MHCTCIAPCVLQADAERELADALEVVQSLLPQEEDDDIMF